MAWTKGRSGNPSGYTAPQASARKRGARMIAELTGDGDEIIKRLLLMSRGVTSPEELERLGGAKAFADGRTAAQTTDRLRMAQAATLELRDQLMGKPSQHVELEVTEADPVAALDEKLAAMTPEQIAALALLDGEQEVIEPATQDPIASLH